MLQAFVAKTLPPLWTRLPRRYATDSASRLPPLLAMTRFFVLGFLEDCLYRRSWQ